MHEVTIGASDRCDIPVDNDYVSRRHCKLVYSDENVWIEDLDSTNGTYVDGEEIRPGRQVRLDSSSEVLLAGKVELGWDVVRSFRPDPDPQTVKVERQDPEQDEAPPGRQRKSTPDAPRQKRPAMVNIRFTGSFGHFFLVGLGLLLLTVVTLGLALPYYAFWISRYFFTNLEIGGRPLEFTGSFGEYLLISIGLFLLSIVTLGLALPYYGYWNWKYFASNLQVRQTRENVRFTGSFGHFFVIALGLLLLCIVTLGLATPYLQYWTTKYFFTNMETHNNPFKFNGSFGEYFLVSLGLIILSIITLGLGGLYYGYWNIKYFASNLEVRVPSDW